MAEAGQPVDRRVGSKTIRILLADDLALIRRGIRSVLSVTADVEIVGEAATGEEAVRLAAEVQPSVILMDQDLPDMDGVAAARAIKQAMPDVEIIVMTDRLDEMKALRAVEAGATGYILKDIPAENLMTAIRAVTKGRAFLHPEIARKLIIRLSSLTKEARTRKRLESDGLTDRELDILIELTKGSTDVDLAAKFIVSEGTVKTHIRHILRKLDCRNRTQAVAYVLRKGLIE